jgi:transcriptional regulator with XRE-family HTH domain
MEIYFGSYMETTTKKISKIWTKEGMIVFGAMMRRSRHLRGWTLRQCQDYIIESTGGKVQFRTIQQIERGTIMPMWNTFCAIAESGFIQANGKMLTLENLMDVASGNYEEIIAPGTMERHIRNCIADLINKHCDRNDCSKAEFARMYGISAVELDDLIKGRELDDLEAVLILVSSALVNPITQKRFRSYQELLEYCSLHTAS